MRAIFKKEINNFFSSLIGYIVSIVFLISIGMFVWIFSFSNVLASGYAVIDPLFYYAPWVLMFLVPAITMRQFSEEIKSGTIELLQTRPLRNNKIILGKYFASLFLILVLLIPTVMYYYTIYQLGVPKGNLDSGAILGSYFGLFMLAASFASIGIFSSSITSTQIVAFLIAIFLCFFCYFAFESISTLAGFAGTWDNVLQNIGLNAHYVAISRGVIDSRDLIYFISFIILFILFTRISLESRKWE